MIIETVFKHRYCSWLIYYFTDKIKINQMPTLSRADSTMGPKQFWSHISILPSLRYHENSIVINRTLLSIKEHSWICRDSKSVKCDFIKLFFQNCRVLTSTVLESVCCKKQQKKVPDQLLVCRIGDLWRFWMV